MGFNLKSALHGSSMLALGLPGAGTGSGKDKIKNKWKSIWGQNGGGGGNDASNLRAKIAREQWQDYKTRFQPLENKLMGYVNNKEGFKADNRGLAVGKVNQAFGMLPAQTERRLGSYGIQMNPQQKEQFQRQSALQQSLGQVQAGNVSNRLSEDQIKGIISGGTLSNSRGLINQKAIGPSQVGS